MKLHYLLSATFLFFVVSCKKEKQVGTPPDTLSGNNYTICANDSWGGEYEFKGYVPSFIFVYNNKAYVPKDRGMGLAGDRRVYIFDGTAWTDVATDTPYPTEGTDASFTIGNKGYVIFSNGAEHARKFYEYNISTNVWTRKADFPGEAVGGSASFTIGTKGYIVGGYYSGGSSNETWEYNPATNSWRERKSLFLGTSYAVGFSIGSKGYITNGQMPNNLGYYYSLMEYDPATNNWTSKAGFPGDGRIRSQCFVIGNGAYVGGGVNGADRLQDFYKYTPGNDTWLRVDDIPSASYLSTGFSINEKGFVVRYPVNNTMLRYNPKYCTTVLTGTIVGGGN